MNVDRKKLTKKQKGYIKIFIANIIFFGVFVVLYMWEQTIPGLQYSAVGMFFFPLLLFYVLWYGFYSYKVTEQILLPNIIFWIFLYVYWFWMLTYHMNDFHAEIFYDYILINLLDLMFGSGAFVGISIICSSVTKWLLKKKAKKKQQS